jgi:hypothetical protein
MSELMSRSSGAARPEQAPPGGSHLTSMARKLGWMALIWAVSVAALGIVSLLIRWWVK